MTHLGSFLFPFFLSSSERSGFEFDLWTAAVALLLAMTSLSSALCSTILATVLLRLCSASLLWERRSIEPEAGERYLTELER